MANVEHSDITAAADLHPPAVVQESDPGAIGAGRGWYKQSTNELRLRNSTNTAFGSPVGNAGTPTAASVTVADTGGNFTATDVEGVLDEIADSLTTSTGLADHLSDATDAHDASAISYLGGTGISATTVEAGLDELATEKADASALTAHMVDASDAHDASAISVADTGGDYTATDVEGVLAEIAPQLGGGGASPASETVAGIAEIATTTETNTGTDDARIVTPLKLAGRTATDTRAGVVELATDAETQTGTDTARAITPANLTARSSTESRAGVIELATQAETDTGTDDARAVTPLKLANYSGLGGGGSDMLLLSPTEVSVTGATTLTSSAFGKMHVCSGTSADYTVVLPAASTHAGQIIGFRMASGLTKLVTLDGNASEPLDTALTRIMWAQESAILLCDGTGWTKISGKSRPMHARMTLSTGLQVTPAGAWARINVNTATEDNTSMMADTTNFRVNIKRPATYTLTGAVGVAADAPGDTPVTAQVLYAFGSIQKNSTDGSTNRLVQGATFVPASGFGLLAIPPTPAALVAGDFVGLGRHFQFSSGTVYAYGGTIGTSLVVQEVPSW